MKKIIVLLVTLVATSISTFAGTIKSDSVTFFEPITVASTTLSAGTYTVSWTEDGSAAKVTFAKGKKDVAVVPATVEVKKNSEARVLAHRTDAGKQLQGLELKHATLNFAGTASANTGN